MSNKNNANRELEKNIKYPLTGLEDMRTDLRNNLEQRYWGNGVNVPFTLHEGLSNYRKYELEDIRKFFELKGVSSFNKAKLIAVLEEKIPELLEEVCLGWDTERFRLLTKIAKNGGYIPSPDLESFKIQYLRNSGIIYTGTFQNKNVLALPVELIEPVLSLERNMKVRAAVKRNTEWIKLTNGMLHYYGTLNVTQLEKLLESYVTDLFTFSEYISFIYNGEDYYKTYYINEYGLSNVYVTNPELVTREQRMRKDVSFYPFSKNQLLQASELDFMEKNESYIQLFNHIMQHYEITEEGAWSILEDCVLATKDGDSLQDVMEYLADTFEFNGIDEMQAFMDKVVNLMNNTKQWFLKGYSSLELRAQEEGTLQPLPKTKFKSSKSNKKEKVGRNDPCPCGSGKKYKKCCGR
ncbi:YecA family protein [Oceanobacillus salinisoli]|uniref:YecA family protein n=1 Tax=Oceanobacillus salinisoli TaxID=2678611 RepID=UPI0012E1938F|nr:SEC-C metal-binding domain-containing protein [Oceanobacillus salinisoli]